MEINNSVGEGLSLNGDSATLQGVTIDNAGMSGIAVLDDAQPIFSTAATVVTGSGLHGLRLDDASDSTVVQNISISGSANSGIRVIDCGPRIGSNAVTISSSSSAGVYGDNSNAFVSGITLSGNFTGAQSANGSHLKVLGSTITGGTNGVATDESGRAFLGNGDPDGKNSFSSISGMYAINANTSQTLYMIGNCYNGSATPKASKFLQAGPIIYLPGSCQ